MDTDLTTNLDDLHPTIRVRSSGWYPQDDGKMVHFCGYRMATIKQAIALETESEVTRRPSWRMDGRTGKQKVKEWFELLLSNPSDALALLRIDRHPSMVTMQYDDSDNWSCKRWARSLAIHKGEVWSLRALSAEPTKVPPVSQAPRDSLEGVPAFLLKKSMPHVELGVDTEASPT
jgi:hypothetical protein